MAELALREISVDWLLQFEREQQQKRSHWSSAAWEQVVTRCLPKLLAENNAASRSVVESYLTLIAEAIGLQLLYPHPEGDAPNIFGAVFEGVIPRLLGTLETDAAQAQALAQLWNLCDAVSQEPGWVEAAVADGLARLESLDDLPRRCSELQQELLTPRPQTIHAQSDRESLSYSAISVWPQGFFLPGTVSRCGPNVFYVQGRSPGISRSFYLIAGRRGRVIPTGATNGDALPQESSRDWAADLIKKIAPFDLPITTCAVAESAMIAAFEGSQQLHLWRVTKT
ncbi:MAG: hypothetical protein U0136_07875 [Bdellovibrionota bacterium]